MAYIATLKKNNTVIYPQTKSTAVYEDDGVTALDTVVVKKSTAAADADKMIKADGAKALVGASNIDFTTLPNGFYESNSQFNVSLSTTMGNTQAVNNLEAGKYLMICDVSINQNDGLTRNILFRFNPSSGTATEDAIVNALDQNTSYWNHANFSQVVNLTSDGTIYLQSKGEVSFTAQFYHLRIYAIRIG